MILVIYTAPRLQFYESSDDIPFLAPNEASYPLLTDPGNSLLTMRDEQAVDRVTENANLVAKLNNGDGRVTMLLGELQPLTSKAVLFDQSNPEFVGTVQRIQLGAEAEITIEA